MVSTASSSKEIDMSRRWWYLVVIDRNYYTELENNESLKNNENKRAKSIRSTSSISSTSLCDNTTQAEMKINETSKQPSLYGKVMAYYGTNTVWENDLSLWRFSPFIYYCMLLLSLYMKKIIIIQHFFLAYYSVKLEGCFERGGTLYYY